MKLLLRGGLVLLLTLALGAPLAAQSLPPAHVARTPVFDSVAALRDTLSRLGVQPDAVRRSALDRLWAELQAASQVPFAAGDSLLMLYRGEAEAVAWAGDMTGWQPRLDGVRVPGTDVWIFALWMLPDARAEYKVVVDGQWMLDPANPLQAWSGFGPNSEIRMPAYAFPTETLPREGLARGTLGEPVRLPGRALGYDVQVRVYTPAGFDTLAALPTLYVTDGHEYAPDHLGALVTTLDNLIAAGDIPPVLAVFIDPRDPDAPARNRREQEFLANPAFVTFVADELTAWVEARYRAQPGRAARVILGTSFGGFFATYLGATRPDAFVNLAVQSPAFQHHPHVLAAFDRAPVAPYRISLSQGTLADGDWGRLLRNALDAHGYAFTYVERNEGHAWTHWRALLPGVLRYHFGGRGR